MFVPDLTTFTSDLYRGFRDRSLLWTTLAKVDLRHRLALN